MLDAPVRIHQHEEGYPCSLCRYLGERAPRTLTARGNVELLSRPAFPGLLALFCSVQCPSPIIVQTYELARALRDAAVPVISGFHSPMEKECLLVLLQGCQPLVVCPARSIERLRIGKDWKPSLQQGRLLILSPFADTSRRVTTTRADFRNQCVAALAHALLIPYATPAGHLAHLCQTIKSWGKRLLTVAHDANADLLALGAIPIRPEQIRTGQALPSLFS
ncbi:MAG: hypothetical protein NZ578_03915 [Candidatus Binatia bacterium]|nr:hypothetical protein [Candidatus Binatia bacterium]